MGIIQAKRYEDPIPVEAVRALAGSMHNMNAIKGIVVATSWFGKASIDFATRSGRIELIDGRNLKALLKLLPRDSVTSVSASGARTVAAQNISGMVITGDGATVHKQ